MSSKRPRIVSNLFLYTAVFKETSTWHSTLATAIREKGKKIVTHRNHGEAVRFAAVANRIQRWGKLDRNATADVSARRDPRENTNGPFGAIISRPGGFTRRYYPVRNALRASFARDLNLSYNLAAGGYGFAVIIMTNDETTPLTIVSYTLCRGWGSRMVCSLVLALASRSSLRTVWYWHLIVEWIVWETEEVIITCTRWFLCALR